MNTSKTTSDPLPAFCHLASNLSRYSPSFINCDTLAAARSKEAERFVVLITEWASKWETVPAPEHFKSNLKRQEKRWVNWRIMSMPHVSNSLPWIPGSFPAPKRDLTAGHHLSSVGWGVVVGGGGMLSALILIPMRNFLGGICSAFLQKLKGDFSFSLLRFWHVWTQRSWVCLGKAPVLTPAILLTVSLVFCLLLPLILPHSWPLYSLSFAPAWLQTMFSTTGTSSLTFLHKALSTMGALILDSSSRHNSHNYHYNNNDGKI